MEWEDKQIDPENINIPNEEGSDVEEQSSSGHSGLEDDAEETFDIPEGKILILKIVNFSFISILF